MSKQSRPRVLIVAPSLAILGGQAVQAKRLLDQLAKEEAIEVSFLAINPRLPSFLSLLQRIKFVRTLVTSFAYLATLLLRVRRYDIIHIFSASYFSFVLAPTPALLISRLFGKRTLLNYHSGEAEDHLLRWHRTAIPILKLADVLVVPSNYLVDVFARFKLRAISIPNVVDMQRFVFRPRLSLRPIFLTNRNFEANYNVACALRAFSLIQQQFPEASMIVAGDGKQRAELTTMAQSLALNKLEFVGLVESGNMPQIYDAADIYLNSSVVDNMPLSIIEAFASGLPVVTTDAGGIPYFVTNEETALVVSKNDHRALAEAAIRLLEDPELAAGIIQTAHRECLKYDWPAVRALWLDLYQQLASRD